MPRLIWKDAASVSMAWCTGKLETAGVGVVLGPGEEDQELIQHVSHSCPLSVIACGGASTARVFQW